MIILIMIITIMIIIIMVIIIILIIVIGLHAERSPDHAAGHVPLFFHAGHRAPVHSDDDGFLRLQENGGRAARRVHGRAHRRLPVLLPVGAGGAQPRRHKIRGASHVRGPRRGNTNNATTANNNTYNNNNVNTSYANNHDNTNHTRCPSCSPWRCAFRP